MAAHQPLELWILVRAQAPQPLPDGPCKARLVCALRYNFLKYDFVNVGSRQARDGRFSRWACFRPCTDPTEPTDLGE